MGRAALVISLVSLVALACAGGGAVEPSATRTQQASVSPTDPPPASETPVTALTGAELTNAPSYQEIPTYEGTGQAVHPDVVYFPDGWHGYTYWLAMTPYPYDTAERENPSILVSDDGSSWAAPPGVTNPLVPSLSCDHNSDPDIVYNPRTDELYLYYTEVRRSSYCGAGTNENYVKLITSRDGVQWTAPQTVMSFDLDTTPIYLSPSVVYRNGRFEMWLASTAETLVYATSSDGITWSPLQEVSVTQPPWHLDVIYVEPQSAYWMLFVDSPLSGANLRFATSEDGLEWSVCPAPVLTPSLGWDHERIYRATFLYDEGDDQLNVWYSARSDAAEWRIGYAQGGYAGLGSSLC